MPEIVTQRLFRNQPVSRMKGVKAYLPEGADRHCSGCQQTSAVVKLDLQLVSQLLSMQLDHIAAANMTVLANRGPRGLELCGTTTKAKSFQVWVKTTRVAHQDPTAPHASQDRK